MGVKWVPKSPTSQFFYYSTNRDMPDSLICLTKYATKKCYLYMHICRWRCCYATKTCASLRNRAHPTIFINENQGTLRNSWNFSFNGVLRSKNQMYPNRKIFPLNLACERQHSNPNNTISCILIRTVPNTITL